MERRQHADRGLHQAPIVNCKGQDVFRRRRDRGTSGALERADQAVLVELRKTVAKVLSRFSMSMAAMNLSRSPRFRGLHAPPPPSSRANRRRNQPARDRPAPVREPLGRLHYRGRYRFSGTRYNRAARRPFHPPARPAAIRSPREARLLAPLGRGTWQLDIERQSSGSATGTPSHRRARVAGFRDHAAQRAAQEQSISQRCCWESVPSPGGGASAPTRGRADFLREDLKRAGYQVSGALGQTRAAARRRGPGAQGLRREESRPFRD